MKTVLILHDDLGFVFWLGHVLDTAAYLALPAKSVRDAALLVRQLDLTVDVLVINLAMAGGLDFIADFQRSHSGGKVIGVLNEPVDGLSVPGVRTVCLKPSLLNEIARIEWLQLIQRVLANERHAGSGQGSWID